MDHDATLMAFDRQIRQDAGPDSPDVSVERVGAVVRQVAPLGGWNGVVWSGLDEDTADAAIAEQVQYFARLGLELEWKHYSHDHPADLADRLTAAGFTAEPAETLMVAEVRELPTEIELPEGVHLRTITDAAGVELVATVHDQAFGGGSDRIRQSLLARLAAEPGAVVAIVAMADGLPVCAARMELHEGTEFASLWGGGTVEAWRGKGIYRALVAYRTRIAAENGYRYLQVDASDQSRPILQRLGFTPLSITTPYLRQPG
jgi:GNAT superfamily N-acetyltransferase